MHIYNKFGIPILKNIGYAPDSMQFLETRSGQVQGHSDSIMVHDTSSSKVASTYQIWDS